MEVVMKDEEMKNREDLVKFLQQKQRVKYLFFWGHKKTQTITKTCLSQWWMSPFEIDGVTYPSSEHYMMASKARLFKDEESLNKILQASSPAAAKKLGRLVKDFDDQLWNTHRFQIVVDASIAKFSQNDQLREFLLSTGRRVLVEASPLDRIWGIGMDQHDKHCENPQLWNGENLLGFALMEARNQIRTNQEL